MLKKLAAGVILLLALTAFFISVNNLRVASVPPAAAAGPELTSTRPSRCVPLPTRTPTQVPVPEKPPVYEPGTNHPPTLPVVSTWYPEDLYSSERPTPETIDLDAGSSYPYKMVVPVFRCDGSWRYFVLNLTVDIQKHIPLEEGDLIWFEGVKEGKAPFQATKPSYTYTPRPPSYPAASQPTAPAFIYPAPDQSPGPGTRYP